MNIIEVTDLNTGNYYANEEISYIDFTNDEIYISLLTWEGSKEFTLDLRECTVYIKTNDEEYKNIFGERDVEIDKINEILESLKEEGISRKGISDGYHTFEELYYHRMILSLRILQDHKDVSWKSKQHHDGTMFDGDFICGIETPEGQYTYHYDLKYWDLFKDIRTLEKAPEYDGHKPKDIKRLLSL